MMDPHVMGTLAAALGFFLAIGALLGIPAFTILVIKFLKFKERELQLEMEFRQKSQQGSAALEQRVERLEDALSSLDHDVREKLGIRPAHGELMEGPGAVPLKVR
jgi:hypothetical protein